jgi:hypothetical protein
MRRRPMPFSRKAQRVVAKTVTLIACLVGLTVTGMALREEFDIRIVLLGVLILALSLLLLLGPEDT